MWKWQRYMLALFLGVLLMNQLALASEDEDDDDDDDDEEAGSEEAGNSDVLTLTTANFDSAIAENSFVLVEFYAPWCGHCKSLAPEYEKAATELKNKGSVAKLAKVDATAESELADRHNVRGYPTLVFYREGKKTEYNGGRTADEIVAWVEKKSGPPAKKVESADEVSQLKEANEVVVFGSFAEGSEELKEFEDAAKEQDEILFAYTTSADVAKSAGVATPSVTIFKQFDEGENKFDGDVKKDGLVTFVTEKSIPLVMEFNDKNVRKIFGSSIPNKMLLFADMEGESSKALLESYRKEAETFRGKVVFSTVDKDKSQVMEYFGLKEDDLPAAFMLKVDDDAGDMKKFKPENLNNLNQFLSDYLEDKLTPFFKSEEIPETNDEPVKVVVGKSWNDIVLDKSKDVLVEFYAPWCGHCKSFAPKYEKLAKKFASVESVVIAKIDGTLNEIEGVEVRGFPTIMFFPAGEDKKAIDFDGTRSVKALTKFLKKNANIPFELPKKDKQESEDKDGKDGKDEL